MKFIKNIQWRSLPVNLPATRFYLLAISLQYLFCRIVLEPYMGCELAHILFLDVFILLTAYYLFERQIGPVFESWGRSTERYLKRYPELWFGIRITAEILLLLLFIFAFGPKLKEVVGIDWPDLKILLISLFVIDAIVSFLSIYGSKKLQKEIRSSVQELDKSIDSIVKKDSVKEVFILTTLVSVFLKFLLGVVIVAGLLGAYSIVGLLLIVTLPYLLISLTKTATSITGSFYATIRYWEWLIIEPPKMMIRFVFKINRDKVACNGCDRIIPLVGMYTCSHCGFTFKGHYFDWCPYCYSRFGYIDCECRLSKKRPLLY